MALESVGVQSLEFKVQSSEFKVYFNKISIFGNSNLLCKIGLNIC